MALREGTSRDPTARGPDPYRADGLRRERGCANRKHQAAADLEPVFGAKPFRSRKACASRIFDLQCGPIRGLCGSLGVRARNWSGRACALNPRPPHFERNSARARFASAAHLAAVPEGAATSYGFRLDQTAAYPRPRVEPLLRSGGGPTFYRRRRDRIGWPRTQNRGAERASWRSYLW